MSDSRPRQYIEVKCKADLEVSTWHSGSPAKNHTLREEVLSLCRQHVTYCSCSSVISLALLSAGTHPMQVGKWLDNQGIDAKPCARANATPALPAMPTQRAVEKLLAAVYAPWNDIDNGKHKPVKVCCCQ